MYDEVCEIIVISKVIRAALDEKMKLREKYEQQTSNLHK